MAFVREAAHRAADGVRAAVGELVPSATGGETNFEQKGTMSPTDFQSAGDYLVHNFPAWQWEPAKEAKMVNKQLPADKQYLVSTQVDCMRRVRDMGRKLTEKEGDDGWLVAGEDKEEEAAAAAAKKKAAEEAAAAAAAAAAKPKIRAAFDDESSEEDIEDPSSSGAQSSSSAHRKYDVSLTYDRYYQTPRVWLYGYHSRGEPLIKEEVYEDVASGYATKTVTVDPHPCTGILTCSIHPCRHAEALQRRAQRMKERGEAVRVDQALLVFLKFISGVIPTISYDFTTEIAN